MLDASQAAVCSVCPDSPRPGCFPTYLRNVLDIMRVGSKCFWVGIHVLRSKCVPVVLLMKTWTFAHDLTDQHNYMKWKMHEKVIVNCFVTSDVFMSADSSFRRETLTWMTHRMFFGVRSCCVSQSTVDRSAIVSHSVVWIIQQRCLAYCASTFFLFVIFLSVHLRSYSYGHLLAIKATKHTVNKVKDRTDCSLFFPEFLWYRSNILVVNSFGHSNRAVTGPRLAAQHVPYWIKCPVAALHSC